VRACASATGWLAGWLGNGQGIVGDSGRREYLRRKLGRDMWQKRPETEGRWADGVMMGQWLWASSISFFGVLQLPPLFVFLRTKC
jgi:hypothetical protein